MPPVSTNKHCEGDTPFTALTPVTITVNPLPGSNEAIVNHLLPDAGCAFPGQTNPTVADGPGYLVVFPRHPFGLRSLSVTIRIPIRKRRRPRE